MAKAKVLVRNPYVASMEDFVEVCEVLNQKSGKGVHGRAYVDRNIVILSCMALLGLRVCEAVSLKLDDIDFVTETVTIRPEISKTGVEREIYLHNAIKRVLQSYVKKHGHRFRCGYLFFSKKADHLIVSAFTHIIRRAMLNAGLAETRFISSNNKTWYKITPYAFRRAFCRELRLKNPSEPLENLAKVTGHQCLDVLNKFYIKLEERPVQEKILNTTFN